MNTILELMERLHVRQKLMLGFGFVLAVALIIGLRDLSSLTGMEFFEAVIGLKDITAVIARAPAK